MRRTLVLILLLVCAGAAHALTSWHDPNPVSVVGDDSFVVIWNTDADAVGSIAYGTSVPPTQVKQDNTPTRAHAIKVEGLQASTDYYYSIVSVTTGSSAIDDNSGRYYRIRTSQKSDVTPPRITNISIESTETSATVHWLTNEPATSSAWYGRPLKAASDPGYTTTHLLQLETTKNVVYTLVVGSCDQDNNCANASAGFYSGGQGLLNVSLPDYTRFNKVTVAGTTVPGATVRVAVNGQNVRGMVAQDGSFTFPDVPMGGIEATIKVTSTDVSGNTQEKSFKVISDNVPPLVTFTQGIPEYAPTTSLTISGSVSEPVTITYGVEQSAPEPERVVDVQATRVTGNTVELQWTALVNVPKYAIYRDGVRVAIADKASFTDSVSAGKFYSYRVAGVSKACQEGAQSSALAVQTNPQGLSINITTPQAPLQCGLPAQTLAASGAFSFSMQLHEGENAVVLEFKDKAGNSVRVVNTTTVDTIAPQFLDNNLNTLSPTYRPLVEVKGQLNKQASVLIYVNDEKPIAVLTNKNGKFSKQIELSRDPKLKSTKSPISVTGETAEGWTNTIKLEAIDLAKRKATAGPTPIVYALCGFGSTFQVTLGKPLPDVITPRLVLQGIQQAGFSLNASYRGGRELARKGTVTIRPLTLSATEAKKYDHNMVRIDFLRNPRNPTEGYVQLQFLPQETARGSNKSMASQEIELSKHRSGECKVPGAGCVRLLLEVEVKAQEKVPKFISDPRVQLTKEPFLLNDVSQKTCVDIELQIDRAIPLSQNIPKKFLEASVKVLDGVMEAIDTVLDPMITVGTYTTYGCMAMNGVLFGMFFSERMACDYANIQEKDVIGAIEAAIGKNGIRSVAEVGMCDDFFKNPAKVGATAAQAGATSGAAAQKEYQAYEACKKCENAIGRRQSLERKMRTVCDRVACPSAPTLQTYVRDFQKQKLTQVNLGTGTPVIGTTLRNNVNGIIYSGNSCSFKGQGGQRLSQGYSSLGGEERSFQATGFDKDGKPTGFSRLGAGPNTAWKISADGTTATPINPSAVGEPGEYSSFTVKDGTIYGTRLGTDTPVPVDSATQSTNIAPTADEALALQGVTAGKIALPGTLTVNFGDKGIKDIYIDFLKHWDKDKEQSSLPLPAPGVPTAAPVVNCAGLHPANPECCGYEYYQEWGSACGIPGVIETFDEIKESACLAAQNANQIPNFEREVNSQSGKQIQCKSLFNAVAGFCEPGSGMPVGDDLPTGIIYRTDLREALAAPKNNEQYVRIEPVGMENDQYVIVRGYIAERVARQRVSGKDKQMDAETRRAEELRRDKNTDAKGQFYLNAELDFVPDLDPDADLSNWFSDNPATFAGNAKQEAIGRAIREGQMPPGFAEALCRNAADPTGCIGTRARRVYADVRAHLGVSDKIYIVRPDRDGVLRSAQCMCLPAVTSYLTFWKNVLGAVRNCFQTVKVTGDASAGVCQAVLSQYVCDMLWDVVSCFTQKYSTPGDGRQFGGRGGIGDIMGALSAAGGDMQRSINSRYGDTALWKSMFVERKLLHSVCAFAFTGTWDLDISGVYKQTVQDIPLKSQGFLYPSERRFISYNPTTTPSGLPTFLYHFGVGLVAGDNLRYEMALKCSNSLRCEPRDGFVGGKCDCFGRKEQVLLVGAPELGNGQLRKNDILNTEVFYTVQGTDAQSGVRYDTAILSWESLNPQSGEVIRDKKEVPIHVIGGSPPNFCQFDPLQLMYRCDIGIGDYTGARFSAAPEPHYPSGQQVFTVGKPVTFDVKVNLQYPQSQTACVAGTCAYTKWVNFEIKNQDGNVIEGPLKVDDVINSREPRNLKIESQGETQRTLQFKMLAENDFEFKQTTQSQVTPGDSESFAYASVERQKALGYAVVVVIIPLVNNAEGYLYSVELFKASELNKMPAGDYVKRENARAPGEWGRFKKGAEMIETKSFKTFGAVKMLTDAIEITVNQNAKLTQPAAEYYVAYQATPQKGACERYKTNATEWTATFKLYDSTAVAGGGVYEYNPLQQTVDPATGEVQSIDVKFNVVCAESFAGSVGLVRACDTNPLTKQRQCFCGSKDALDKANERLRTETPPPTDILNCGEQDGQKAPAATGMGYVYCVYVNNNPNNRECAQEPGIPLIPVCENAKLLAKPCYCGSDDDLRGKLDDLRSAAPSEVKAKADATPNCQANKYCVVSGSARSCQDKLIGSTNATTQPVTAPALPPSLVRLSWEYPALIPSPIPTVDPTAFSVRTSYKDKSISGALLSSEQQLYPATYNVQFTYIDLPSTTFDPSFYLDDKQLGGGTVTPLQNGQVFGVPLPVSLKDIGTSHVLKLIIKDKATGAAKGQSELRFKKIAPIRVRYDPALCPSDCTSLRQYFIPEVSPPELLTFESMTGGSSISNDVNVADQGWTNFDVGKNKPEFEKVYAEYIRLMAQQGLAS